MYQVIYQEENKIELSLWDELTSDELQQIVHQLESLCTMYPDIHVLFDAGMLEKYSLQIVIDEYDFYKKYKKNLKRVAVVSDKRIEKFFLNLLSKFSDTEIKIFDNDQIEEARKWIFPSKLP